MYTVLNGTILGEQALSVLRTLLVNGKVGDDIPYDIYQAQYIQRVDSMLNIGPNKINLRRGTG